MPGPAAPLSSDRTWALGSRGERPARRGATRWHEGREAMDLIRILLAIVLPPLGVFLQVGVGLQFWLNILLTLLGYVPGIVHAVYIILTRGPDERPAP